MYKDVFPFYQINAWRSVTIFDSLPSIFRIEDRTSDSYEKARQWDITVQWHCLLKL